MGHPLDAFFVVDVPRPAPPPRNPAPGPPPSPAIYEVRRLVAVRRIPDANRGALLTTVHSPLDLTFPFWLDEGRTRRSLLLPVTCQLSTPLSVEERQALQQRQQAELEYFDNRFAATRGILLRLVDQGADPIRLLSLLLRYARQSETGFPQATSARFTGFDFHAVILHRRRELPLLEPLLRSDVPIQLEARTTVTPPPPRRRTGPPSTGVNLGMWLLSRHLKKRTRPGRPHLVEVAELFGRWGAQLDHELPDPTRARVWHRLARLERRCSRELRARTRDEANRAEAEAATFRDATFFQSHP